MLFVVCWEDISKRLLWGGQDVDLRSFEIGNLLLLFAVVKWNCAFLKNNKPFIVGKDH